MAKPYALVTNNPKAKKKYEKHNYIEVIFKSEWDYLEVLTQVRDRIHAGWHLLSHPQASNLKPNQCPFKTVLISSQREAESMERDIELIELSISAVHKFTKGMVPPKWPEKTMLDFQTIDLSVVDSAIDSSLMRQMMYGK